MRNALVTLLVATAACHCASAGEVDAFQEPLAPAVESDDWQFRWSVYAPVVSLDGTTSVGPNVLPVDVGFSDIAESLDGGFVSALEARKGRWSLTGDFIWLKLSTSTLPNRITHIGSRLEQYVMNASVGFEVYEDAKWTVDALVGAAYTGLKIDSDISVFPPLGGVNNTFIRAAEHWVDPFVGVRFRYRASDRWRFFGRIDYGGFGVQSDTYFQAIVGGGYQINENVGLFAAYRHLLVDYSKAAFSYDVETSGPQLGVLFTF